MDNKKEVARLQRKVSKWLKEWLLNPMLVRNFRDKPPALYEAYLAGEDEIALLGSRAQKIHFWHLVHYENAVLNDGQDGLNDLALAVRYAEAHVRFEEAFANAGKNGSLLKDSAVLYFSLAVLAGQKDVAGRIGKALVRGLDTWIVSTSRITPTRPICRPMPKSLRTGKRPIWLKSKAGSRLWPISISRKPAIRRTMKLMSSTRRT